MNLEKSIFKNKWVLLLITIGVISLAQQSAEQTAKTSVNKKVFCSNKYNENIAALRERFRLGLDNRFIKRDIENTEKSLQKHLEGLDYLAHKKYNKAYNSFLESLQLDSIGILSGSSLSIADLYNKGLGVQQNKKEAYKHIYNAAVRGNQGAQMLLALKQDSKINALAWAQVSGDRPTILHLTKKMSIDDIEKSCPLSKDLIERMCNTNQLCNS